MQGVPERQSAQLRVVADWNRARILARRFTSLEMTAEKLDHSLHPIAGKELRPAVSRALDNLERDFRAGGFELFSKALTLLRSNQWVLCPMHDEERCRFPGSPREGASFS